MTVRRINEEVEVLHAHLKQDKPNPEFIVRHAETLLLTAHEWADKQRKHATAADKRPKASA